MDVLVMVEYSSELILSIMIFVGIKFVCCILFIGIYMDKFLLVEMFKILVDDL